MQHYRLELLMDLVGMAEGALVVPLSAEAAVPKLQLSSPVLEYGECFLGHGYSRTIELVNESKLPARFEVLDQVGRAGAASAGCCWRAACRVGGGAGQCTCCPAVPLSAVLLLRVLAAGGRGQGRAAVGQGGAAPSPQDPASSCLASFAAEPASGVVPAKGRVEVAVQLVTRRLGRVQAPARVRVAGSRQAPLEFAIDARSVGPHLEFGAPGQPRWG